MWQASVTFRTSARILPLYWLRLASNAPHAHFGEVTHPESIPQLIEIVRSTDEPVLAVGSLTKPALSSMPEISLISMSRLSGLLEYEPTEYTFTALAGTPVSEIQTALRNNGQYLPFDPLLVAAGATLGGTIAASANGAGRLRFGGVRDFLVGIQFVDGAGRLIRGGGKVVKNAAGFDFPKLFTGSMGRLGILTEVTFKVFPEPRSRVTLEVSCAHLEDAIQRMNFALGKSWEIEAAEILSSRRLLVRIGGEAEALPERINLISSALARPSRILQPSEADEEWNALREFSWLPSDSSLIKIPLTSLKLASLDSVLGDVPRVYSQGGNVAWVAWDQPLEILHPHLAALKLTGVPWRGSAQLLGLGNSKPMEDMVKNALDPTSRYAAFPGVIQSSSNTTAS